MQCGQGKAARKHLRINHLKLWVPRAGNSPTVAWVEETTPPLYIGNLPWKVQASPTEPPVNPQLPAPQEAHLWDLLQCFPNLFSTALGRTQLVCHPIPTPVGECIWTPLHLLLQKQCKIVEQ